MDDIDFTPAMTKMMALVNEYFPEPDVEDDTPLPAPFEAIIFVVIYLRLSKEDRKKKTLSRDVQLDTCTRDAERAGRKVLKVFDEDARKPISGKAFSNRPGWKAAEKYLRSLPISKRVQTAVLVYHPDRYSRSLEEGLHTTRMLEDELRVRVRSAHNPVLAPETPDGFLPFVMDLMMAEVERKRTVTRTRDALAYRKKIGRHLGHWPKHFEEGPDRRIVPTQKAIDVLQLRAQGMSYGEIAGRVQISKAQAFNVCRFVATMAARSAPNL